VSIADRVDFECLDLKIILFFSSHDDSERAWFRFVFPGLDRLDPGDDRRSQPEEVGPDASHGSQDASFG
jgi:hypothetical protein